MLHLYSINLIKYERKYPAMNKICRFLAAGILLLLLLSGCAGPNSPSALESSSSGSSSSEPGSSIESSSEPEPSSQEESSSQTASSTPEAALPQTFTVQVVNEEGEPEPNLDVYIWYSAPTPKQPDLYDLFTAGLTDQQGLTRQFSDVPATNLILEVYNHSINSGNDEESAEEYPFTPEEIQAQNGKVTLVWHKQSYREASEANAIKIAFRVVDQDGNPVQNASVDFICTKNPSLDNTGKQIEKPENDEPLPMGGYTDADGYYFYSFPSNTEEHQRDGFQYRGTATAPDGRTAEGELTIDGGYTEITLTLE